jgi:hypothetical protein
LGLARQLAFQEKVANFEETGFFSQLFNRVAPVGEYSRFTIDVCDS